MRQASADGRSQVAAPPTSRASGQERQAHVCMHVLKTAHTDVRVWREATALRAAGIAVTIVDLDGDGTRPREETIDDIRVKHVRVSFTPSRIKPLFLVKYARVLLLGALKVLSTPADAYHAHDVDAFPACYVAARARRKALVLDAHELPLAQPNYIRWRRLHGMASRLLRAMMPRCSGVITVSEPLVHEIQQRYGGVAAVVVRNLPTYQETPPGDRLRQYLGLGAAARVALYHGALQAGRALDLVIEAGRYLEPGNVIVLMGDGPLRATVAEQIAREGVGDRVKLMRGVPYAELLTWVQSADLGLIVYRGSYSTNVEFCLPNKLFEYLMAGVPVLASPLPAVVDILERYEVGMTVQQLDSVHVGQAINGALGQSTVLARMQRNALAASQRELRWDREQEQLVALYHGLFPADRLGL